MLNKKGQSTLDYLITFAVVVGALLYCAQTFLQPRVKDSMDKATKKMVDQVDKINFGGN